MLLSMSMTVEAAPAVTNVVEVGTASGLPGKKSV